MYNSKVRHDLLNLCCINTNCGINIPLTCSKMGVVKGFVCFRALAPRNSCLFRLPDKVLNGKIKFVVVVAFKHS